MNNPNVDIKTEKAQEIIQLYRDIENTNLRKISHMEWDTLDFREKKKIQLQIQYDAAKQQEMFKDIVGTDRRYITDILVKALQDDVNKDTLWRLFGDVIYDNIKTNLAGTKLCKCCGERFESTSKKMNDKYCFDCAKNIKNQKNRLYRRNSA